MNVQVFDEIKNKIDELYSEHSNLTAHYKKTSYGLEKLGNAEERNREFKIFSEELGAMTPGNQYYTLNISEKGLVSGSYIFQVNINHGGRLHNDLRRFMVV